MYYLLVNENDKPKDAIIGLYKKQEDALKEWEDVYQGDDTFVIIEITLQ